MNYELLVRAHLIFGTVALATFWLQMLARKAGALHRRAGQVYFGAMALVVVTAIPMTVILSLGNNPGAGLMLGFLATLTVSSGASAMAAARFKNRFLERQQAISRVSSLVLLVVSLSILAMTPWGGAMTLGLGGFGTWLAVADLRTKADAPVWQSWLARHIEGVLGTGIAVHVAFMAFGLRRLLGASYTNLHFLLAFAVPTVVGMVAASLLVARFAPSGDEGTSVRSP